MAITTAAAFSEYVTAIAPTVNQWNSVNSRFNSSRNILSTEFDGTDMPLHRMALMGSAAKGTIIRPIDDVDAMAVFANAPALYEKYKSNSQGFLYRVRDALAGKRVETVGSRGQAVRLFYVDGGHVDIAPVLTASKGYLLPAGDGTWITTDPEACTSWLNTQDGQHASNLKPLVQLLKKWNRAHSSRMRSFHLETVAASMFTTLGNNQRANLRVFFEHASKWLPVKDPSGHSGRLDLYLSERSRSDVVSSFSTAHKRAVAAGEAEASGNHEESLRLWKIILGADFPSYS
ncbi:nucleotidyltransferase [Arthrobacter sp. ISL-5]|uniref:nucleotidyltransferase domain-containing protein n=1 Tax=Arthrobacter sp. ISL-5 TaxID=2819111 RepID=UPI001BE77510|nr:nucleotidyltransferase [Arthrobacter sp. ISL-5]MBT2555470.1 nucleotidyltransferase [Arthrobacter sp. ISL-5]